MEITGKNLLFQTAFESVASGIEQTTEVRGRQSIQNGFETFSASTFETVGSPESLSTFGELAQFPEPLQYFQNHVQRNIEGGSGLKQKEFLDVLQDKNFNPNSELAGIAKKDIFDTLSKQTEGFDQHWWKELEKRAKAGPYIAIPPPPPRDPDKYWGTFNYSQWYHHFGKRREELLKQTPTPAENDALQTGTQSNEAAFSDLRNTPIQSDKGEVLNSDKISHLNLPPKLTIPHPQPAQLSSSKHESSSAAATGPVLQGKAQQSDTTSELLKIAKQPFIPKEPEEFGFYEPNSPQDIADKKQREIEKKMEDMEKKANTEGIKGSATQTETITKSIEDFKEIQGMANQTETIKDASEKATSDQKASLVGGPIVGLLSKLHWDDVRATEIQGSADQTETIKNASQPVDLIRGTADQTETIKKASAPATGGSKGVSKDLIDQFTGGSSNNADQRGIIVVGGKSSGTYFETIDDTLAKINQNPQPKTIQLFEHQVGALQDLSSTVQKSIQMNEQVSSAITGRFRV